MALDPSGALIRYNMKQTDKAAHEATSAIFEALNYSSGQIAAVLEISAKAAQQKKTGFKVRQIYGRGPGDGSRLPG